MSDIHGIRSAGDGLLLPLAESFYSVQGEGYNTGRVAWFIRLGGCDVRCPWCDSKGTWNPDSHPLKSVQEIIGEIALSPAVNVIITGGEPLMHNRGGLRLGRELPGADQGRLPAVPAGRMEPPGHRDAADNRVCEVPSRLEDIAPDP